MDFVTAVRLVEAIVVVSMLVVPLAMLGRVCVERKSAGTTLPLLSMTVEGVEYEARHDPGTEYDEGPAIVHELRWAAGAASIDLIRPANLPSWVRLALPPTSRRHPAIGDAVGAELVPGLRSVDTSPDRLARWLSPERQEAIAALRPGEALEVSDVGLRLRAPGRPADLESISAVGHCLIAASRPLRSVASSHSA